MIVVLFVGELAFNCKNSFYSNKKTRQVVVCKTRYIFVCCRVLANFSNPFDGDVMTTVRDKAATAELQRLGVRVSSQASSSAQNTSTAAATVCESSGAASQRQPLAHSDATITLTGSVRGTRRDALTDEESVLIAWSPPGL